ncbi:MutS-related protein [Daejeonella sp.]|uniref:MutS-related protein n=1 Tax=Daejeonella sp. TaxID=2805397 RepID=UPI003982EC0F
MNTPVIDYYQSKLSHSRSGISRYEILINKFSILRLIVISVGILLFYQSLKLEAFWLPVLVFFAVIIIFSFLVRKQNFFEKKRNYFKDLSAVYLNEIESIEKRTNIYSDGSGWEDDLHPYTSDLDIFGKGSLFELINRCATVLGNAKLAEWLQKRAVSSVLRERQTAVEELASKQNWKHTFQALLFFSKQSKEDHVRQLFQYLKTVQVSASGIIRFYVKWAPWTFALFAGIAWFFPIFIILIIVMGIANLLLMQAYNSSVMKTDSLIGKMSKILGHFSEALSAIGTEMWKSSLCDQLASELTSDEQSKLPQQIKRLSVLIKQLSLGLSNLGPVLNFIMPWNVIQFFAIEDWKNANKANIEDAFAVIASFEALISLSNLRNNYPDWVIPEIIDTENYTLTAKSIGHPLISSESRVTNDYSLNNELKIDIITGSNMAGKSTFLRTLGINTVLALSGAPVCAEKMEVSPMLIFSYMRIRDSLNENTSTFKAELDRLQSLLETLQTEDKVFFLIDEMLRGTNSVDKYLGSKAIIEKLISQNAVGIIATHDLQIADLEEKFPQYIRNFYFDIEIEGTEMKFDYKLKEGECKTFNASLLLKRLGIEV